MLLYLVYWCGRHLGPHLPGWLRAALATALGDLLWLVCTGRRRAVLSNLTVVRPALDPAGRQRLARQVFRHLVWNYLDLFATAGQGPEAVDRRTEIEGWEYLEQALALGRGVIVAAPHLGPFDTLARVVSARGLRVTLPVEPVRPRRRLDLLCRVREGPGLRLVPLDEGALGQALIALRRGEIVALGADRDIQGIGVTVTFFGQPARLPDAPAVLALRTGAPIIVAGTYRLDDGRYRLWLLPPLVLRRESPRLREEVQRGMQQVARRLETVIGLAPEQWVVTTPLWQERAVRSASEDRAGLPV